MDHWLWYHFGYCWVPPLSLSSVLLCYGICTILPCHHLKCLWMCDMHKNTHKRHTHTGIDMHTHMHAQRHTLYSADLKEIIAITKEMVIEMTLFFWDSGERCNGSSGGTISNVNFRDSVCIFIYDFVLFTIVSSLCNFVFIILFSLSMYLCLPSSVSRRCQ